MSQNPVKCNCIIISVKAIILPGDVCVLLWQLKEKLKLKCVPCRSCLKDPPDGGTHKASNVYIERKFEIIALTIDPNTNKMYM